MKSVEEMFRVDGKIALVTGAAGGIGLACARALALAGADLILADIMEAELEAAGEQIRELGVRCRTVVCDVSDLMAVEALTECVKDFGGADILIHSAAITNRKQLLEMSEEEWRQILTVNLDGAYLSLIHI